MVIPDWSARRTPEFAKLETFSNPAQLARPNDRLAALIVDLVILTPVEVLACSPLKRWFMKSYITSSESDFFLSIFAMTLISIVVIVGYQTLFHFFMGATPGKRLFGLKVEAVFVGERLSLWDCFFRSLVWIFELFCLGIPWLAIFSNEKRRPLHDRICDSIVVTRANSGVLAPLAWEKGLVRGLFASSLALLAVFVAHEVQTVLLHAKSDSGFLAGSDKDLPACEAVAPFVDQKEEDHARLKMAMSLYAAGLTERSCLEAEVEREVAMQSELGPITYLAQAFVYADDSEVSNSYLDKVCEENESSVECAMSRLVSAWSDEDWAGVEEILRTAERGSGYLEVWGVRHYMRQGDYASALGLLDNLVTRHELGEFSLIQRIKALFNTYREAEAQSALAQAVTALPEEGSEEVSAWMCAQQLQNGCEALSGVACQATPKLEQGEKLDFENSPVALAQLLTLECKQGADYLQMSELTHDESWQIFLRANLKRERQDRSAASALYTRVLSSRDTPELLRVESARRLAQIATAPQLKSLVGIWSRLESKEAWIKVGNLLFARLSEQKDSELALKVARHLMNAQSLSPQSQNVLTAMVDANPDSQRRPASVKTREQVKKMLNNLDGGD